MSIVQLKKITLYGCLSEKIQILDDLQALGCLHISPLYQSNDILEKRDLNNITKIREAYYYLNNCPKKLKQIKNDSTFAPTAIQQHILQNKSKMENLQAEGDALKQKIETLLPWGSFVLPDSKELLNQKFWFYKIPHHEMKAVPLASLCAQIVQKDNQFSYVVVVSEDEPTFMPGSLVKLPTEPLNALKTRLDQIEFETEDLQIERISLTRWLTLFERNLALLEDQATLTQASHQTYDNHSVFAIQGWIPTTEASKVLEYAKKNELAIKVEDPVPGQQPPTLLDNKAALKGGEDLLSFYMTPGYWLWDPSTTVFFSFAVFFAMIFSDAGYAVILGAIVAFFWKSLGKTISGKRFRNVLVALTAFSFVWGLLVGSYFGIEPPEKGFLKDLKIIDLNNYAFMMTLAIFVGIIHLIIANLAQAWAKRKSLTALENIGWTAILIGVVLLYLGHKFAASFGVAETVGNVLIGIGFLAILFFTSVEKPMWKRLVMGLMGLTRITGMFGDVLSYLRLFALGLASASLAVVFNDLAKQVYDTMPGFKILFALLILLIGHGMNFILSLMSGFIHGLRLNFIEFFNWSLPEEGTPFKAFSKKETSKWNQ